MRSWSIAVSALVLSSSLLSAGETVDLDAVSRIRQEGFHNSRVMETARHLTDHIGPRITGSPALRAANEWTRDRLAEWGFEARLEDYEIDHGWSMERCSVHMVAPYSQPLSALPKAWTPATDGPVRGRVVRASLESAEDLEKYRGTLEGAILLLDAAKVPDQIESKLFKRYDDTRLAEVERFDIPEEHPEDWRVRYRKLFELWPVLAQFMADEGVVATIEASSRDNLIVRVDRGGSHGLPDFPTGPPAVVMAAEQYNRLVRLVEDGVEVELELEVGVSFHRDHPHAYNTIADLPGTDLADEIVLVGAHLDSFHAGTGATDNGGSCAVVMEALRLLRAAGLQPRRTVRVALWSGEEQGFWGSRAYISKHLATRPEPTDPEQLALPQGLREPIWPITPLEGHGKLAAYFNVDFGSGRVRGIFTQENAAVRPIFEAWLEPLHDLGATTVSMESVGGTDHLPFDRVGLPAFQFIQDGLDYMGRTHHSNADTFDHLHREDLMQSSVVLATFLWHAANRDELLPRKPMPQPPAD